VTPAQPSAAGPGTAAKQAATKTKQETAKKGRKGCVFYAIENVSLRETRVSAAAPLIPLCFNNASDAGSMAPLESTWYCSTSHSSAYYVSASAIVCR